MSTSATADVVRAVRAALPAGEDVVHAGWVVRGLGGRTRAEEAARLTRSMTDPAALAGSALADVLLDAPGLPRPDPRWFAQGRAGALVGAPDSDAARLDARLPATDDNPVVLAVTAGSLAVLAPARPLPPPPVRAPEPFLHKAGKVLPALRAVWDGARGRPYEDPIGPVVDLAPMPSPAPALAVIHTAPRAGVRSVAAGRNALAGLLVVTFTDGSGLRIAVPGGDQHAFAAALAPQA